MKLISYTVNNNKLILIENIVVKIFKNTYNIYMNNSLYYSYNKKYFLKFIQENYNKYYHKINILLSNTIKGGSASEMLQNTLKSTTNTPVANIPATKAPTPTPKPGQVGQEVSTPISKDGQPIGPTEEKKTPKKEEGFLESINIFKKKDNNTGHELNILINDVDKKNNYLFIFQILSLLNKIIPSDINIDTYVNEMYKKIMKDNSSLVFTEQYLLKKLNKKIRETTINICKEDGEKILKKYIPNSDTSPGKDINIIIENSLLLEKIKRNIDTTDVKNKNEVHFLYKFNIKQEGLLWDGDIEDFLDKIFTSSEMKTNLDKLDNIIKYNLNKDIKKKVGSLKIEEGGILSTGTSWDIVEIDNTILNNRNLNNYTVKTKYNTFEKKFELIIKFDKKEFDIFLNRGVNKLEMDEENNKLISNYMENLHIPLLEILNKEIKKYMEKYVDLDKTNTDDYKKNITEKILNMIFRHIDTNNLSMFNFVDLESTNTRLLNELIEEKNNYFTELFKSPNEPINDLLHIKFSKCSDIDISQCNKKTVTSVCELVKYRDIKKLPKTFLDDFEYNRKLEPDDKTTKTLQLGLILKNITEKTYMKTKELKLKLSTVFVDSVSKNIKKHLKNTLYSFKFDMIYSEDFLKKQISDIGIKTDELSEILNNDIITFSDLSKMDTNLEDFNSIVNRADISWASWNPLSSSYSAEQINLKKIYLNTILRYTIKLNHVDLFKQNLIWTLHSKLLIYHLFKFIEKKESETKKIGSDILKSIVNKILPKMEVLKSIIKGEAENDNRINITIFDLVNVKKLEKLKLQKTTDSQFIESSFSSENVNDKKYKNLEELEQLIFKTKILTETNEEFLNSIMFFYKKTGTNNWEIVLDENKQKYRDIYTNKLTRNIRNYYKNILETKFNEINNEHIESLEKLGLNIPDEEISEDIELSAQLEEELNKLNDTKYKLFQTTQSDMENILKYIQTTSNKNEFFEFIINKYVIAEHKFPFDFSSEYEKTKTEFNINLKDLLDDFSNMKQLSNITNAKKEPEKPAQVAEAAEAATAATAATATTTTAADTGADTGAAIATATTPPAAITTAPPEPPAPEAVAVADTVAVEQVAVSDTGAAKTAPEAVADTGAAKTTPPAAPEPPAPEPPAPAITTTPTAPIAPEPPAPEPPAPAAPAIATPTTAATATPTTAATAIATATTATITTATPTPPATTGGTAVNSNTQSGGLGNIDNSQDLENFISKISQNLSNESNPNNINVAISKLQLMYAFQNRDYKTLINKYSKLTDSYNKLIKLEKINKIPITSKPAILTMIDKLFINNLSNTNNKDEEDEKEEDDLNKYSNKYNLDDENSVNYKQKKQSKKIIKDIEYKLFDGLKLKNNSSSDNTSVVFGTNTGELIN